MRADFNGGGLAQQPSWEQVFKDDAVLACFLIFLARSCRFRIINKLSLRGRQNPRISQRWPHAKDKAHLHVEQVAYHVIRVKQLAGLLRACATCSFILMPNIVRSAALVIAVQIEYNFSELDP